MIPVYRLLGLSGLLAASAASAQLSFTAHQELLPFATHSGNCMAATDMNDDGRDDLPVLDMSNTVRVLYQNADGHFVPYEYGAMSGSEQWGMAVADIDNDGHKDIFSGGYYDGAHYLRISAPGVTSGVEEIGGYLFMQCASLADMDNDGWLDALGCHDDGPPQTWVNNGLGNLASDQFIDFSTTPYSDMSGNYGSVFTDFDNDGDIDLYIAHCRQGVNDPNDPRRWDRLFVNDGTGNYTDMAATYGLQNHYQTWCADFGDWDNDGDEDMVVVDHDHVLQFFQNDGTGHFTDIGDNGLNLSGFFMESHFEDLDNDGFLDILIGGSPDVLLKGNGDGTFTNITSTFSPGQWVHSFAIADLNDDGAMDVWASYGTGYTTPNYGVPDVLFLNDGNDNHWLNVKLRGVLSNRDAIGARVTLTTALGTQIREVRAGESYGLTNTAMCHFGLGSNTTIATLTVHWPSGQVDTYSDIAADQSLTLIEGTCIAPTVGITSSNGLSLCSGSGNGTTLSSATTATSYLWSTGETTPSITVDTVGAYTLTVDPGDACSAHTGIFITQTPVTPPTITADADTELCPQDQVTLTSTTASSYLWSTNDTTQSITVSGAGDYSVTVAGGCPGLQSNVIHVTELPAPPTPTGPDVTIPAPGNAVLTASDPNVNWYDVAAGGSPVGSGSPWTTQFLPAPTTYWCGSPGAITTVTYHGGLPSEGTTHFPEYDDNFYPVFSATANFTLHSVKVYAGAAGPRTIALVNWPSGTVINQAVHTLPAGESVVQLDLAITPGTYALRCIGTPDLSYDHITSGYPFPLGTVGQIIGSSNGSLTGTTTSYFELFYDWVIQVDEQGCASARSPVHVLIDPTTGIEDGAAQGVQVYPIPAGNSLTIGFGTITGAVDVDIVDITGRVVRSARMVANTNAQELDISGLSPGEYALRMQYGDGRIVRHIQVR
jgi:hypothetical protein